MAIRSTPSIPEKQKPPFAITDSSIKPATPDLILFDDNGLPIEIVTALLFEDIGSIEILNIARSDIINGREVSYGLLANTSDLSRRYSPRNMFKLSGTLSEFFENFSIKFKNHVPEVGTGPNKVYAGLENSFGCVGFPVLRSVDNELLQCFSTLTEAQNFVSSYRTKKNIVYSDPQSGDLVVDVINLKKDDLIEIEILVAGRVEDDTIY